MPLASLLFALALAADPAVTRHLEVGQPVEVDGHTLVARSIVWEQIEASPVDPVAYPPGSGVTVALSWDGQAIELTRLSEGYTSVEEGWGPDHRIALGSRIDEGVDVLVERLEGGPVREVTVRRGERVDLGDGLSMRFDGHSHKMMEQGESPLMVNTTFLAGDSVVESRTFYLEPGERTFRWRRALCTLRDYDYGERMDLTVQIREGSPR